MSDIIMTPVTSSNVVALGHDGAQTMRVRFRSGFYDYFPVQPAMYEAYLHADSIGREIARLSKTDDVFVQRVSDHAAGEHSLCSPLDCSFRENMIRMEYAS